MFSESACRWCLFLKALPSHLKFKLQSHAGVGVGVPPPLPPMGSGASANVARWGSLVARVLHAARFRAFRALEAHARNTGPLRAEEALLRYGVRVFSRITALELGEPPPDRPDPGLAREHEFTNFINNTFNTPDKGRGKGTPVKAPPATRPLALEPAESQPDCF
jgi:hypothetical protein